MKNIFKLPIDSKGNASDKARSGEDWAVWKNEMKEKYPIRYFLNNDFESTFIWPWSMPLRRAVDWIQYRTTRRYHVVNTGMEPGYSDLTEKMLHVNFNMLKNFIEREKAHMYTTFANNDLNLKGKDAGIAHLMWEMSLADDESWKGNIIQSENAREQYELYNWWTNERPNRVEPLETPEHTTYWKLRNEIYDDSCFFCDDKDTSELKKLQKIAYKLSDKLEKKYTKEDEKNLIRLIKIRQALWT